MLGRSRATTRGSTRLAACLRHAVMLTFSGSVAGRHPAAEGAFQSHAGLSDPRPRQGQLFTWGIFLWAVATGFLRLGTAPIYINNEAREGVYVRAMLDTGDWVLPHVPNHVENGEIVPDKPPLFHWISASVASVRTALTTRAIPTGSETSRRFDEWALRFPSVVCGVLMVMSIAVRGRRLLGDRTALLAAASLLMSVQYIRQSQYGRVDMTMAAFVTLSLLLLGEALLEGSPRALLGAAAASGLAVLGKGPVGLALPVLVGTTWIAIDGGRRRSLRWALDLPWGSAGVVWAGIVLPWYFTAYAHGGMAFIRSQLLSENFRQYIGGNGAMPWAYYVRPWLYQSCPWNVLGILGVGLAWRTRDRRAMFCTIWWLVFLVFFQVSAYKRAAYLLPALPAGAMMSGYFLDAVLPSDGRSPRDWLAALLRRVRGPALAVGIVAAGLGACIVSSPIVVRRIGVRLSAFDGGLCGVGIVVTIVGLGLLIHSVRGRRWWVAFASLWLCEAGLFHGVIATGEIAIAARHSPKPLVARVLADLPGEATVTVSGLGNDSSLPVLLYFPDPARIVVVPTARGLPTSFAAGYYLFSHQRWAKITRAPVGSRGAWHVLWADKLRGRKSSTSMVFVEHRS